MKKGQVQALASVTKENTLLARYFPLYLILPLEYQKFAGVSLPFIGAQWPNG